MQGFAALGYVELCSNDGHSNSSVFWTFDGRDLAILGLAELIQGPVQGYHSSASLIGGEFIEIDRQVVVWKDVLNQLAFSPQILMRIDDQIGLDWMENALYRDLAELPTMDRVLHEGIGLL